MRLSRSPASTDLDQCGVPHRPLPVPTKQLVPSRGEFDLGELADKAGFITGENICIDGGMTRHNDFSWELEE